MNNSHEKQLKNTILNRLEFLRNFNKFDESLNYIYNWHLKNLKKLVAEYNDKYGNIFGCFTISI